VAGLAALLRAAGKSNADAANQIRGAIDPISGRPFGRINVAKALGAPVAPLPTATPVPATPTPGATATYIISAPSTQLTTVAVANLAPSTAQPGATKVPVLSFTLKSSRTGGDTFQSAKIQYSGTNVADVQTLYLYREGGGSGGTFDPSADILLGSDSNPTTTGEFKIGSISYTLPKDMNQQFYIVVDLKSTATVGNLWM
jgi:hypothetical protein